MTDKTITRKTTPKAAPPQTITTPHGETLVVLPLAEFESLRAAAAAREDAEDARDHAAAVSAVARGKMETLSADEVKALLAAPTPLGFWRKKRGLTQVALAAAASISQSYLAGLETSTRKGDPALIKRLAELLRVSMEDLVDG